MTTSLATPATTPDRGVWNKLLPELTTLALLLALVSGFAPDWAIPSLQDAPMLLVLVEGAMLLLMWTLIDLASRLSKPPPWWLGLLIIAGLFLFYPDARHLLEWAWQQGYAIFLPVAWSVIERLRELWTLPRASRLEKFRRRALSHARVFTALYLIGILILIMLLRMLFADPDQANSAAMQLAMTWLLIVFYAIAAWDAWRVHRPAFERTPRMLWRHSHDDTTDLDPP